MTQPDQKKDSHSEDLTPIDGAESGELVTPRHGDPLATAAKEDARDDEDAGGDQDLDTIGTEADSQFPRSRSDEPTSF